MALHIITVGSPELPFARQGIGEYIKRLSRFSKISIHEITQKKASAVDALIRKKVSGGVMVLLDEAGDLLSSRELSNKITHLESVYGDIFFIIGGPDGHTEDLKKDAHLMISLSRLTYPHDIATLILTEALYRSKTIQNNHPYHRD
ncbi:50S rRNA methyltransferase [Candidatus Campbellbacteria bacterium]|nr:50S rRNA methyltransferase [Candidatus Campbellbacteria bacterium]|tara:strand:- start:27 stop:464 length:438 start_codon:yes stop_codon:yes gene_type:complete